MLISGIPCGSKVVPPGEQRLQRGREEESLEPATSTLNYLFWNMSPKYPIRPSWDTSMRIFWHIGGRHGDNLWMEDMSHWCSFEILFWTLSPGMPVRGEREAEESASWPALPLIEALPWANLSYLPATDALPRATSQLIPVLVAVIQPLCLLPINHSTASSKCQAASLKLEINLPPQQICQT